MAVGLERTNDGREINLLHMPLEPSVLLAGARLVRDRGPAGRKTHIHVVGLD